VQPVEPGHTPPTRCQASRILLSWIHSTAPGAKSAR
jgi:hypothetical protein